MSLKDSWNIPEKRARLEMADAERRAKKAIPQEGETVETQKPAGQPQRYRLYDKIKVSVRTMDIIIYSVIALLVLCIIIGIATGGQA